MFLTVSAEIFEEDVAEGDGSDAGFVMDAQAFFYARFVNRIDALRRDADFMQRKTDGLGLLHEKFAADAVHADAVLRFGDGGPKRCRLDGMALPKRMQQHGPALCDGAA